MKIMTFRYLQWLSAIFAAGVACSPRFARAELNLIRPGQEGTFNISKLHAVKGTATVIGTFGGYEISELKSPVDVSSMGKMMALDSKGRVWFVETREDKEICIDPATLEITQFQLPAGGAPYSIAIDRHDVHWLTAHGIEM